MLKTIFPFALLMFITSCGIHYVTPPTPISLASERRAAIQQSLRETFEKDSSVYSDIAWGKTKTLKPLSYMDLDSLHRIKYKLENQGKYDPELEDNIKIQRQIALNDTTPILYIEDHLFSVKKDSILTVYSAYFETTKDHVIRNSEIKGSTNVDPKMMEEYKIYTFEESFLHPGYALSYEEKRFYSKFKTYENSLTGNKRDEFLNHALKIISYARNAASLATKNILMRVVKNEILGPLKTGEGEVFETMEELLSDNDGRKTVMGYQIVYSYKKVENGLSTTLRYVIRTNEYYQVLEKNLL